MAYHHGSLRTCLLDAATDLARAGGPDAVVLRAATRAAGVSHNAAYRHFADRDAMLAGVGERCMSALAQLMEQRLESLTAHPDPAERALARLVAAGRAYVEFAQTEPGWFRTAFCLPGESGQLSAASSGTSPFAILNACLDDLVTAGALPEVRRPGAEYAAWAAVHGIATLLVDGPLRAMPAQQQQAAIDKTLAVVTAGLRDPA